MQKTGRQNYLLPMVVMNSIKMREHSQVMSQKEYRHTTTMQESLGAGELSCRIM